MTEEPYLIKPILIRFDISRIEEPFDIHCPLCGKRMDFGADPVSCPHVAIDLTPERNFLSESILAGARVPHYGYNILRDILENGCSEYLLIYELYSEGIACGPSSDTHYVGFSFKELEKLGVKFLED